jgi:hypothetical protein
MVEERIMNPKSLVAPRFAAPAFAATLFAAAFVVLAPAAADAGPAAKTPKATFVKGDVSVSIGGAEPSRVKRNQEIAAGSVVKTGEGARAELTFPDGSVVRVGPGSELKVEGAAYDGKTKEVKVEATLVAGEAWAKVAKLVGDDPQFQVKTNNAVAGVRGTVFRVNVDRDEATVVKVYNGAVAVAAPLLAGSEAKDPGSPINPDRKPIPPPFKEVSKKEFEHLLGKMMAIRIPKNTPVSAAAPVSFTAEEDKSEEPEWVRWNSERDAGKSTEKSD